MTTILLTGCAGFIGFHVANTIFERGDKVIGIDNLSPYYDIKLKEARLSRLLKKSGFSFIKEDISHQAAIERIFANNQIHKVCHLAAQAGVRYSLEDPYTYETSNNKGTLVLLEACRHFHVQQFVFASSSSVYGKNQKLPFKEDDPIDKPISVYAATKMYTELLAHVYHQLYGINCTGLRLFTVYGPWGRPDMALFKFTKAIEAGKPIELYNEGRHARDFTYIQDIVKGIMAALEKPFGFEIFNLARGKSVPLLDYVNELESALGKKAERRLLPMQPGDIGTTKADITKAHKLLGYEPSISIQEGVQLFVEWYREQYGV